MLFWGSFYLLVDFTGHITSPHFLPSSETGGLGQRAQVVARVPDRILGRGTGSCRSHGKTPELFPPRMKQKQAGLGFLVSRKGPRWGLKEEPDHSISLIAKAERAGVSEESPSFMAGLGAARPEEDS